MRACEARWELCNELPNLVANWRTNLGTSQRSSELRRQSTEVPIRFRFLSQRDTESRIVSPVEYYDCTPLYYYIFKERVQDNIRT